MAYNPITDFLALLRQTSGGMRSESIPGMDYIIAAMARADMFQISVGQSAPVVNVESTVWVKPASPAWVAEATIYIYNTSTAQYEPATPTLWASILTGGISSQAVQEVTDPGPIDIDFNAGVVLVNQTVSAAITLVMPVSAVKLGGVLVVDWKGDAAANPITIQMSGANKLPGNQTSIQIGADRASIYFRPIPQGYAT